MTVRRTRLVLAGGALLAAAAAPLGLATLHRGSLSPAHAQTAAACTNASLNGSYGALVRGNVVTRPDGSPQVPPLPLDGVGVITVDGAGNISDSGTTNVALSPAASGSVPGGVSTATISGTYDVNPDCSFTITYTVPTTLHSAGVIVDGGKRVYTISTGPTLIREITWERQ